ncbi:hypothetical protein KOR42_09820 [Thalassoglobus neptunius]|uniref:Uncharacterized protein n=1 Tax=Thalassoglobus neptunius TaxID=1938619 RepID=A0A5C5X426_9PLAN|nr:hypothetical protein [Thalassoglobus neptunius]TWT57620.1 hypothetical protein KOR42_09820 [Thalassoglobus neptunius]
MSRREYAVSRYSSRRRRLIASLYGQSSGHSSDEDVAFVDPVETESASVASSAAIEKFRHRLNRDAELNWLCLGESFPIATQPVSLAGMISSDIRRRRRRSRDIFIDATSPGGNSRESLTRFHTQFWRQSIDITVTVLSPEEVMDVRQSDIFKSSLAQFLNDTAIAGVIPLFLLPRLSEFLDEWGDPRNVEISVANLEGQLREHDALFVPMWQQSDDSEATEGGANQAVDSQPASRFVTMWRSFLHEVEHHEEQAVTSKSFD